MKAKLDRELHGYPGTPHVIAHSFGTYVTGTALRKFPNIKLGRIVLVGSILPAKYDWEQILTDKLRAFEEVRNEQGKRDSLVSLAGTLGWHRRDVGDSGVSGFKGKPSFVHHATGPLEPCDQCQTGSSFARIHNIPVAICSSIHTYGPDRINSQLTESETRYIREPISISEDNPLLQGVVTPLHASKRSNEIYTQAYIDTYKLKAACFRLSGKAIR